MPYDLFISYSSKDWPWAEQLYKDLSSRKVNCFLDRQRLKQGETWEPRLLSDLEQSRHFVVLWSEHARNSDWVGQELHRFKARIDPNGRGPIAGHLLYAINLEGKNNTLGAYQGFIDAAIQTDYEAFTGTKPISLQPAAQQEWNSIVAEVAAGVGSNVTANPVPVSVLAMTSRILEASPPMIPELNFVPPNVDQFLSDLGVGGMAQLGARYGDSPFLWRPYGSSETVWDLLESLLPDPVTGINSKLGHLKQPPVRWIKVDIILPRIDELRDTIQQLLSGPSVLIIDPVSLFSPRIWQRYVALAPCFSNPQAAIVFLTPFSSQPHLDFLSRCLREQGRPNLEWFDHPIPNNPGYANCGVNIMDKWDIRRLVLASLGRQKSAQSQSTATAILGT